MILNSIPGGNTIRKSLSLLMGAAGLYFMIHAGIRTVGNMHLLLTGSRTIGIVLSSYDEVAYSTQTAQKRYGTTTYIKRPIIQYSVNGNTYQVHGQIYGEFGSDYNLEDHLEILYPESAPDYSQINNTRELWYEPMKDFLSSILLIVLAFKFYPKSKYNNLL